MCRKKKKKRKKWSLSNLAGPIASALSVLSSWWHKKKHQVDCSFDVRILSPEGNDVQISVAWNPRSLTQRIWSPCLRLQWLIPILHTSPQLEVHFRKPFSLSHRLIFFHSGIVWMCVTCAIVSQGCHCHVTSRLSLTECVQNILELVVQVVIIKSLECK